MIAVNNNAAFVENMRQAVEDHWLRDSGGPMEIDPRDLARLLALASEGVKKSMYPQLDVRHE